LFSAPVRAVANPDHERLSSWSGTLRAEQLTDPKVPLGRAAVRVGELARGTPYEAYTLEAYLRAGGDASTIEPLTLWLTRFDCVSLVESCLAVARAARGSRSTPAWNDFAREIERMRYRGGQRGSYASRLHYFSEWISDGARRGLLQDIAPSLGAEADTRPLRFMTEHRKSYVALADDRVFRSMKEMEKRLDRLSRRVIPTARIASVEDRIQNGDILGFATSTPGLDVTHCGIAVRDSRGTLRVAHAPLSGGGVEVSKLPLAEYLADIRGSTGIMVARPI
jgi:cell wall-associated NlpC family hydrolase